MDLLIEQIELMEDFEPGAMTLIVDGPSGRYIIIYRGRGYYLNFNGNVRELSYDDLRNALQDIVIISIKLYIYGVFENIYGAEMREVPGIVHQILIELDYEDQLPPTLPLFQAKLDPNLTFNESDYICSICQEYINTDICKNKKCVHYYHCLCITSWINHDRSVVKTCPECRADLDVSRVPEIYHSVSDTFEFGKLKISLKTLWSDLKYLKSI